MKIFPNNPLYNNPTNHPKLTKSWKNCFQQNKLLQELDKIVIKLVNIQYCQILEIRDKSL